MTDAQSDALQAAFASMAAYHLAAEMRRLHGEMLSPEEAADIATTRHDFDAWTQRLMAEIADWQAAGIARAEALFAKDDARKIAETNARNNWNTAVELGLRLGGELDADGRLIVPASGCGCRDETTWRHDLGTVVGGVLLAAGLIAAIVWGIYG